MVSEPPRKRSTLLVRLLGAGRVLTAALRERNALPKGAPERSLAALLLPQLNRGSSPSRHGQGPTGYFITRRSPSPPRPGRATAPASRRRSKPPAAPHSPQRAARSTAGLRGAPARRARERAAPTIRHDRGPVRLLIDRRRALPQPSRAPKAPPRTSFVPSSSRPEPRPSSRMDRETPRLPFAMVVRASTTPRVRLASSTAASTSSRVATRTSDRSLASSGRASTSLTPRSASPHPASGDAHPGRGDPRPSKFPPAARRSRDVGVFPAIRVPRPPLPRGLGSRVSTRPGSRRPSGSTAPPAGRGSSVARDRRTRRASLRGSGSSGQS